MSLDKVAIEVDLGVLRNFQASRFGDTGGPGLFAGRFVEVSEKMGNMEPSPQLVHGVQYLGNGAFVEVRNVLHPGLEKSGNEFRNSGRTLGVDVHASAMLTSEQHSEGRPKKPDLYKLREVDPCIVVAMLVALPK